MEEKSRIRDIELIKRLKKGRLFIVNVIELLGLIFHFFG